MTIIPEYLFQTMLINNLTLDVLQAFLYFIFTIPTLCLGIVFFIHFASCVYHRAFCLFNLCKQILTVNLVCTFERFK